MAFFVLGERYVADVEFAGHRLRLFSEVVETGPVALVYDLKRKQTILRDFADDLEQGKRKCESCLEALLGKVPSIMWNHQP